LTVVRRGGAFILAVVLLLAACGGGGSPQLSASAYRAQLAKVKQEAATAQTHVGQGLHAKTVTDLKKTIDQFAADTQRIGDEVAKLKPPKNAEAANTQLAQGLHDIAAATRTASGKIATMKTVQEAISYLEHSHIATKGSREVGSALAKLQKLGYTTGS
jgi:hypothetical protein